jgi:hypothetical protein
MSDFTRTLSRLDSGKRVNYSFGLVLGVDEFRQEQYHLLAKFQRHNRQLHGFGTVWGLKVNVPTAPTPADLEVQVEPGFAISPGGHEICVPARMCTKLNAWLGRNATALSQLFGTPPFPLSLCVLLCYRECETDDVPIPGEPCRSDDDVLAPSRIADSFELKLAVDDVPSSPPVGVSELLTLCQPPSLTRRAEEAFGVFLRNVEVSGGGTMSDDDLRAEVLRLADPNSLNSGWPGNSGVMNIAPEQVELIVRTWAVEVLPRLQATVPNAPCGPDESARCLLLARLSLTWDGTAATAVTVAESGRPILLSTRAEQEWLSGGGPTWT